MTNLITIYEENFDVELIAKEFGISVDRVVELNEEGEIHAFGSAEDCFYWLKAEDADKGVLREFIKELGNVTYDDLKYFRSVAEREVYNSGALILDDGRIVHIYNYTVDEKRPLIPIKILDKAFWIMEEFSDYANLTLSSDELNRFKLELKEKVGKREHVQLDDLAGIINVFLFHEGYEYTPELGYVKQN